jgi:uncharacterized repeat protein (TIGR03803 family)
VREFISTTILALFLFALVTTQATQAQTFTVLHAFTSGQDGANPYAGLTIDKAGNLYGTAYAGGINDAGTVFKLTRKGSGWRFNSLYSFANGNDGADPASGVIFGPDGSLYGATNHGGGSGFGTVFNLRPPVTACKAAMCSWTETTLHRFAAGPDGHQPTGDVIFDNAGNIYGICESGGAFGYGAIYELTPSGGNWTESVLYSFTDGEDGNQPYDGVILDNAGNLYGTAIYGGVNNCTGGCGTVFELMPQGSKWVENTLYLFQGSDDGDHPYAGLILDPLGNLYGATSSNAFSVFELTPSGGSWAFSRLYNSPFGGLGPAARLTMDAAGNLYGTTVLNGKNDAGSVFKLTPSNGTWIYTSLHDFTGGSDGAEPWSNVIFDTQGNLYGTASEGGANGYGVVFEITP